MNNKKLIVLALILNATCLFAQTPNYQIKNYAPRITTTNFFVSSLFTAIAALHYGLQPTYGAALLPESSSVNHSQYAISSDNNTFFSNITAGKGSVPVFPHFGAIA